MLSKKNIGRPKKEGLTTQIKFNVTSETAQSLKNLAEEKSISQAELMRQITPIISSSDYETMLPVIAIEQLQKKSDECWAQLHSPLAIYPTREISDYMPAFVTTWNPPILNVKYPTFKINIYSNNMESTVDHNRIDKLIEDIPDHSSAYDVKVDYFIVGNEVKENEVPFITEVMCLSVDLKHNIEIKNDIVNCLKKEGYLCSVSPSYCLRQDNVELLENGKYFRIK